jgi:hypothetical protein
MISLTELSEIPLRQGNLNHCLLCSYSAAMFPFTRVQELNYFVDFCKQYNIKFDNSEMDSILKGSKTIYNIFPGGTPGSGYDWIEQIHNFCQGNSFQIARKLTNIIRHKSIGDLENDLHSTYSSSVLALNFGNGQHHSICVIKNTELGFIARDSNSLSR